MMLNDIAWDDEPELTDAQVNGFCAPGIDRERGL